MIIGVSIVEAIDWSQDLLESTRPVAERALFSLLKDKLVVETEHGYEYPDDEDREKVIHNITKAKLKGLTHFKAALRHNGRQYSKRADIHIQRVAQKKRDAERRNAERYVKSSQSDEADDMLDADAKN